MDTTRLSSAVASAVTNKVKLEIYTSLHWLDRATLFHVEAGLLKLNLWKAWVSRVQAELDRQVASAAEEVVDYLYRWADWRGVVLVVAIMLGLLTSQAGPLTRQTVRPVHPLTQTPAAVYPPDQYTPPRSSLPLTHKTPTPTPTPTPPPTPTPTPKRGTVVVSQHDLLNLLRSRPDMVTLEQARPEYSVWPKSYRRAFFEMIKEGERVQVKKEETEG